MTPTPPGLPTRFPCWCRAIYSWGGESKRDLGFVEGDLIECLNAGDGSWWMGRLRRDRRMMGVFPSNFVTVLDDAFRPVSRASSSVADRSPSPNPQMLLEKKKSKTFRRPFQSYAAPDIAAEQRAERRKQESLVRSRQSSPCPTGRASRAPSLDYAGNGYGSRAVSPEPSFDHRPHSRGPSRAPSPAQHQHEREGSQPPPPPPAHRSNYQPHTSHASYSERHQPSRPTTPNPDPSVSGSGLTPSPLRTAIDDVMTSLEGMGGPRRTGTPDVPLDPWSPEAFDQTYSKTPGARGAPLRPKTSMGIADKGSPFNSLNSRHGHEERPQSALTRDRPPQFSNYVERMESRLKRSQMKSPAPGDRDGPPPMVPPKTHPYEGGQKHPPSHNTIPPRPKSSMPDGRYPILNHRKSAFEVGRQMIGRTFTTKSTSTNASTAQSTTTTTSSSTQATSKSVMSGSSAGAVSATSAGSLARKKGLKMRAQSALGHRADDDFPTLNRTQASWDRPETPISGVTYHSSHASSQQPPRPKSQTGWNIHANSAILGGFVAPKPKKSGFFKKIINSARTGAANARTSIAMGEASRPLTSHKSNKSLPNVITGFGNGFGQDTQSTPTTSESPAVDWVQFRRDVNRSNSLSQIERVERKERCHMMDHPTIDPVEELFTSIDGDADSNGHPIAEPTNFQAANLTLVDKNARFINSLPSMTNPMSLATGYICRPYRSDVQRLRAIFIWVSEKIVWEEDFDGQVDTRNVIQTKRGSAEEVAVLVTELCAAVGIHAEVVRGYLKPPGEILELGMLPHPNHWWNAVVADGEWRMMDCSLASPSNPRRGLYSSCGNGVAESWWFLSRPSDICWTHVPEHHEQQHLCPPVATEVLLALPCACPPFFKNMLEMVDYDTSLIRIEDLELVHIKFTVPSDVECVAEVEARAFARDADGDFFESGEIIKKRALSQAEWVGGRKRYTIKALLPGDEGQGVLKIYAGKRGLMHSIKDIVHPLAFVLPIIHTGENPPYEFLTRHPTPHAQRHDLYVAQPQCQRLAMNNTFVFAIRQHPSSLEQVAHDSGANSPGPYARPSSAMSITSSAAGGSNPSTTTQKPAKLAIQSPGGKIMRLMRKEDRHGANSEADGGTYETIIKCGERGVWRGLVLADRSARWCVFAEWTCV